MRYEVAHADYSRDLEPKLNAIAKRGGRIVNVVWTAIEMHHPSEVAQFVIIAEFQS